ncbi:MAG: peptide deformylase [Clostridia bacterium]
MVKAIVKDILFLGQKSESATKDDTQVAIDLMDTLNANADGCVGLAANMIGYKKCVIIFDDGGTYTVMFNPKIIKSSGKYETEEGCLSLTGLRPTTRYKSIKVEFQDINFKPKIKTYKDFTAQIIQHEIDHCNGIII